MLRQPLSYLAHTMAMAAAMRVRPIPLFGDNYCWLITNEAHRTALLVDPADQPACAPAVAASGCEVVAVLYTHWHADHAGDADRVADAWRGATIVAGADDAERIGATVSRCVVDGETLELGGLSVRVLHTPCHTRGHTCYLVSGDAASPPVVFTGDTLFSGGCGKFFEGDATVMAASLAKLAALPSETLVACGHEYTASNLAFAAVVEPASAALAARTAEVAAARAATSPRPTVPVPLATELATNVFLRLREPAVIAFAAGWLSRRTDGGGSGGGSSGGAGPAASTAAAAPSLTQVEVLSVLRQAKNEFKAPLA